MYIPQQNYYENCKRTKNRFDNITLAKLCYSFKIYIKTIYNLVNTYLCPKCTNSDQWPMQSRPCYNYSKKN